MTDTRTHTSTQVRLSPLPEPTGLKRSLRALAEECPARALDLLGDPEGGITAWLWERWGPALRRAGLRRDVFVAIADEYRRELWYWVWGNRTWAQCSEGLAGRLARRADTGSA